MNIAVPNATLNYFPDFIEINRQRPIFERLLNELDWQQEHIMLYGKSMPIPRLQAWYGDPNSNYAYSGLTMAPQPWLAILTELKMAVEQHCHCRFNAMLANLYRDQSDSVAWHSDDEHELGDEPIIASLSFGDERNFQLKHKVSGEKLNIPLKTGSLLVMSGETQRYWQHCLPKTKRLKNARINLTFRQIKK